MHKYTQLLQHFLFVMDYAHILNFQPTLHVMTLTEIYQFLKILFNFQYK